MNGLIDLVGLCNRSHSLVFRLAMNALLPTRCGRRSD